MSLSKIPIAVSILCSVLCQIVSGAPVNESTGSGVWSPWSAYSECTASCGGEGTQLRTRSCADTVSPCLGELLSDYRACPPIPCASDEDAAIAAVTVPANSMQRRTDGPDNWPWPVPTTPSEVEILPPEERLARALEAANRITVLQIFPRRTELLFRDYVSGKDNDDGYRGVFGTWSQWSAFTECTASCGMQGVQYRVRICVTKMQCRNPNEKKEWQVCPANACSEMENPLDGEKWSDWSACSETCGFGQQMRRCKGKSCPTGNQHRACNLRVCSGKKWDHWSEWSSCSATCGVGMQSRVRGCEGGACVGLPMERRPCLNPICRPEIKQDRSLGDWMQWSACSTSCGLGTRVRVRKCPPEADCWRRIEQKERCSLAICRSVWEEWSNWSTCSHSCDPEEQTRVRLCSAGGCIGPTTERKACNPSNCLLH